MEPNRAQAIYIQLGVSQGLIESCNKCITDTEYDTEDFRHRLEILVLGLKMTRKDMLEVLKNDAV